MDIMINFGGFYETIHSDAIDRALSDFYDLTDEMGDVGDLSDIPNEVCKDMMVQYCIEYINKLNSEVGTDLVFKALHQPRYYNYETDTITVSATSKDFLKIVRYIRKNGLKEYAYEHIRDVTTAKSGYSPFYAYGDMFCRDNQDKLAQTLCDIIIDESTINEEMWSEHIEPTLQAA